jgi:hypothetical protein
MEGHAIKKRTDVTMASVPQEGKMHRNSIWRAGTIKTAFPSLPGKTSKQVLTCSSLWASKAIP